MKTFRDNKRRVWTLEVNVAAIKRVRGLCKVDLNSIVEVDSENRPTAHLSNYFMREALNRIGTKQNLTDLVFIVFR